MGKCRCAEVREHLWEIIDGEASARVRAAVEHHLAECPDCRREMNARRRLWYLLKADTVPPGGDVAERVLERIARESRPRRPRFHRLVLAAAAAALLLAVALLILPSRQSPTSPTTPTTYLQTQLVSLDQISDIELFLYADFIDSVTPGEEPAETLE